MSRARTLILSTVVTLGALCAGVVACAEPPPVNSADAMHFGTAATPTYLSVDGRTVLLFNPLMNIVSVRSDGGPPSSGKDLDTSCKAQGTPCVILRGIALSEPPHMGTAFAPKWKAGGGAQFQITGCVQWRADKCVSPLISSINGDGARGSYVYSLERGVELFAHQGQGGYDEVFVLTAERGLLVEGTN